MLKQFLRRFSFSWRIKAQHEHASRRAPALSLALARFFPDATPGAHAGATGPHHTRPASPAHFSESIVIEFGTPREVLFACNTPLEFGDDLQLRNSDGSFDVEVSVVAVQYHPGKHCVAARFRGEVPNWIVKS